MRVLWSLLLCVRSLLTEHDEKRWGVPLVEPLSSSSTACSKATM